MPHKDPEARRKYHREYARRYRPIFKLKYPEKVASEKERRREYHKSYYAKNRQKALASSKEYQKKNGERLKLYHKARYQVIKDLVREQTRRKRYGDKYIGFNAMMEAQGGHCAICLSDLSLLRHLDIHVDHDHESGLIRRLLCKACNHLLGWARDNPNVLRNAADYIERYRST